jgi:hypothetical protein
VTTTKRFTSPLPVGVKPGLDVKVTTHSNNNKKVAGVHQKKHKHTRRKKKQSACAQAPNQKGALLD